MNAEFEHEVLTSLSDTIVELHAAEEALYLQMLEGRKRIGELVARVTFLRTKEQRLRDLLLVQRLTRTNEPQRCDVCNAERRRATHWPTRGFLILPRLRPAARLSS